MSTKTNRESPTPVVSDISMSMPVGDDRLKEVVISADDSSPLRGQWEATLPDGSVINLPTPKEQCEAIRKALGLSACATLGDVLDAIRDLKEIRNHLT